MKKRTGLIGLGTITKNYMPGIVEAPLLELVAVCDVSPTAASRDVFAQYTFYEDYREMIERERLEYVVISTTPALHYEIAKWALLHGVCVLVEKPGTVTMAEYEELVSLAEAKHLVYHVMFHWQTGSEVVAFSAKYSAGDITAIKTVVFDHYSADGVEIDDSKKRLGGVWLDSGVNILSMLRLWLPFERVSILGHEVQRCKASGLPIYLNLSLEIDGVAVNVVIDWRHDKNRKQTVLCLDGHEITVDHSAQTIRDGDKSYPFDDMERLPRHYYNYFTLFDGKANNEMAYVIHKLLFEVNELL